VFQPGRPALNANQILMGHLSNEQAETVLEAGQRFRDLPLAIDDSSALSVGEIGARCRSINAKYERAGKRLRFVVIDYLKFIRASERYRGQRYLEVGEITGGLKALAKDLGVAVILLCQLNRETEKAQDRRPELSHLRDSGEIEQDADVVMFLYREAYYLTKDEDALRRDDVKNKLEIIIAKQRMGACGTIEVFCHPGASALRNVGEAS
jgi:replicative DNA helicase